MMRKKGVVAILGCGPSALIAANHCDYQGVPFVIFSRKQKSRLGGAQYSHVAILPFHDSEPEALLTYEVLGSEDGYRKKVYGDAPVPFVSVEGREHGERVAAWSLRELYDKLWEKFESRIVDIDIDPRLAGSLQHSFLDLVVSSVPLPAICAQPEAHWFKSQTVLIFNEALDEGLPDNTIRYDGTPEHSYYRMSRIFGVGSTEWSGLSATPPLPTLKTVRKPILTNCDCHPNIFRIGRFGTWTKGELTFHAALRLEDKLRGMGLVES
jgi:hypothetical protein